MKAEIKYKTFDELLADVAVDFHSFENEGMIDPAQLIKVVQRVNYDLGLKINTTKEVILEISHGKAKLPSDFEVLNYAVLCGKYEVVSPVYRGRYTENVVLNSECCKKCGEPDPTCSCQKTYSVECNTGEKIHVQVIEKRFNETRIYDKFEKITISNSGFNKMSEVGNNGYIKNNFLYTNVKEGKVFISYQGSLEDDEGNLLVVDNPYLNEYYEYALKQRILENLYLNGEDVSQKLQLIETRLRSARNNALSIVNTPDLSEMKKTWELNRKIHYAKYYKIFT